MSDARLFNANPALSTARVCPKCGQRGLNRVEGCWTCAHCDFSQCG